MKRNLLLKTMLLLCALVVGTCSLWATEKTITLTYSSFSLTNSYAKKTATVSGIGFTVDQGFKGSGNVIQMNSSKGSGILYNTTAISGLKSIKVNVSSGDKTYTITTGTTEKPTANSQSGSATGTYNAVSGDTYFQLKVSGASYFSSIVITYDEPDANQVATPAISIPTTTPFVSSKVVTMSCTTEDASIYYTMTTDGSTPADPTTSSTLYDASYKPTINVSTKFKAIAVKDGMTNSSVGSATFTKETILEGISELNAATTSTTKTPHYVRLTNAQITYVESSDDENGFLDDADAGIYLWTTKNLVLNTKYNGIYQFTTQTSNALPRVTDFEEVEGCSSEVAEAMDPVVMTASDLEDNFSDNVSRQIKIVNHTLPNTDNKLTANITLYNIYHDDLVKNKTYTLIGYPTWYNTGKQFRVVEAYPKPETPTFDFADGNEFNAAFTVHLSCETEGVTFYYTTDGNTPTTSSTLYNTETGIAIPAATTTVKAIAFKDEMVSDVASATYTYKAVAKPYFTPATGSEVFYGETVEIATATSGEVSIYYTTDGTNPTSASTPYTAPVAITTTPTTLKAIAIKGSDESSVGEASFTIKAPESPTFNVEEGAVARNTVVTISSRAGTTIFYTTNGDDAESGTNANSNSVEVSINEGMTIKAIAKDPLDKKSSETSATFTIAQVAKPTFSVAAGVVSKGTQLTINTATEGATIYYTLDGTAPTSNSTVYNGYVVIGKVQTVKAIALKENYIDSEVMSAAYTVAGDGESFVFKNLGYSDGGNVTEVNGTNVSLTFAKSTGSNDPKYYDTGKAVRMYKNNTLNISSVENTITAIVFTFVGDNTSLALSNGGGSLSAVSDGKRTWTGSSSSITFYNNTSGTDQARISTIEVFFDLTEDAATIGDSKLAGYCSEYALNFCSTGLKAYKAKVEGGNVVLTEIADGIVPAYEGVVLSGDADDYDIPFATTDATADFTDNEMVGVTQRTQVLWNPSDGVYNYILQQGQFNKATTGYLKPNRAYLSTSYNVTAVGGGDAKALTIVFNDATTGINGVEEMSPVTKTRKVVKNGRLVIETPNGEFTIDGAKVK